MFHRTRSTILSALTIMAILISLEAIHVKPVSAAEESTHFHGVCSVTSDDDEEGHEFCLDFDSTITRVLGVRNWVRYQETEGIDEAKEKANLSTWIATSSGCNNAKWVEVGVSEQCMVAGGCDAEHPTITYAYFGEATAGMDSYTRIKEKITDIETGDILSYVALRDDPQDKIWWLGISRGSSWIMTYRSYVPVHEGGRAAEVGLEHVHAGANVDVNDMVTESTWFIPQISIPPNRDTSWQSYPSASRRKEDDPPNVPICQGYLAYVCSNDPVFCPQ